jgi:hypothetical protein
MSFRQDAVRAANEKIYQGWLAKHPEILPCEANRQIIYEFVADDDENISDADLDFVESNVHDRLALVSTQASEPEQPDPAIAAKLEVERLKHLTRDELRVEMHLAEKQRLQQLYAKPPLPTHWTVDGKEIELNVRNFMALDKSDIRKILRIHGAEQVDRFLGVKPRTQPGNIISFNL